MALSTDGESDCKASASTVSDDAGYGFAAPIWAPKAHRKPRLVYPTKVLEARAEARVARQQAKAAKAAKAQQWRDEMERQPRSTSAGGRRPAPEPPKAARGELCARPPPAVRAVLPGGWLELTHPESGAPYFHHRETGETTWVRPAAVAALPDGWSELVDPERGISYFYDEATGNTTWRRPAAPEPEPGAPPPDAPAPASESRQPMRRR